MRQSVLNANPCLWQQASPAGKAGPTRKLFFAFLALLVTVLATAQTYTTKADGAWSSAATWVGGVVPSNTISSAMVINIGHDVTYDLSKDLSISGKLNVVNDTLRFPSAFGNKTIVTATGVLTVKNGGYLQDVTTHKSNFDQTGGRVVFDNAKVLISKGFDATSGAVRFIRNTTLQIGQDYSFSGISTQSVTDTLQNATIDVSVSENGNFTLTNYGKLYVANTTLRVNNNNFVVDATSSVTVLPTAANNYGFSILRVAGDLQNDGAWNARIDAACIGGNIKGTQMADIDFTRPEDCSTTSTKTPAPELSFTSPVLKSGVDKKEGAVYRFSSVLSGVDAEVTLKKFSRSDIVMGSVDYTASGFAKAFQPEFGLSGYVGPYQDWYVDFEMIFYEAGTTKRTKIQRTDFTAIDVDGDNSTLNEYTAFNNPANIAYSPLTVLQATPVASLGTLVTCPVCNVASVLAQCLACHGTGVAGTKACATCSGTGVLFSTCSHSYTGVLGSVIQGTTRDYSGIDTNATSVMATFQYVDVDHIDFRYGARTGLRSTYSPTRLYSLWSKSFNLSSGFVTLPVDFTSFSALAEPGSVLLHWQVEQQKDLSYFVVQRSTDGETFYDLATIGAGTANDYLYRDKAPCSSGILYYRVMGVDNTKESRYTNMKAVRLVNDASAPASLTVYPNPAASLVSVVLPANWQGKEVQLQLIGANGTVVKSTQMTTAGSTQIIDIASLPKGIYLLKAACGAETCIQRLVKN